MENTIGKRIALLRKQRGLTQEDLAERMGVSGQAVSKWENDLSCPDIALLSELSKTLGVTVDELLTGEKPQEMYLVPEEKRKPVEEMVLRIRINYADGKKTEVNLPVQMLAMAMESGVEDGEILINGDVGSNRIDPERLLEIIRQGFAGKILEVENDVEHIVIWVE